MQVIAKFIGKLTKLAAQPTESAQYRGYLSIMQRNEQLRQRALLNRRTNG